jgi:hypothetical protein
MYLDRFSLNRANVLCIESYQYCLNNRPLFMCYLHKFHKVGVQWGGLVCPFASFISEAADCVSVELSTGVYIKVVE